MTLRDHEVDQSEEMCRAVGQFLAVKFKATLQVYPSESELIFSIDNIPYKLDIQLSVQNEVKKRTVLEARQERTLGHIEQFMEDFYIRPSRFAQRNHFTYLRDMMRALVKGKVNYNCFTRKFSSRL